MRNNMRKILSVFLFITLVLGCFAGCSTGEEESAVAQEQYVPDSTLRILMVGNSFCYYYVEELCALLMENPPEGIETVEVYNLYYSGCKIDQHLNWWQRGEAHYDFYKTDATGRQKMTAYEKWTLEQALALGAWDYISLQGSLTASNYLNTPTLDALQVGIGEKAAPILNMFHQRFPHAKLLWHCTWFFEVGRVGNKGYTYTQEDGPKYNAGIQQVCSYMCGPFLEDKPYEMTMVNTGAAWTEARRLNEAAKVLPYGGLCARLGKDSFGDGRPNSGDGYHDGDIGGGQLLNAYVWYMTITGNTDLTASTYSPVYTAGSMEYPMPEAQVALLKEAAMNVFQK